MSYFIVKASLILVKCSISSASIQAGSSPIINMTSRCSIHRHPHWVLGACSPIRRAAGQRSSSSQNGCSSNRIGAIHHHHRRRSCSWLLLFRDQQSTNVLIGRRQRGVFIIIIVSSTTIRTATISRSIFSFFLLFLSCGWRYQPVAFYPRKSRPWWQMHKWVK